jgi:hypothetical protein
MPVVVVGTSSVDPRCEIRFHGALVKAVEAFHTEKDSAQEEAQEAGGNPLGADPTSDVQDMGRSGSHMVAQDSLAGFLREESAADVMMETLADSERASEEVAVLKKEKV